MENFVTELEEKTKYSKDILEYIDLCTSENSDNSKYLYNDLLEMSCSIEKVHELQKNFYFDFQIDGDLEICFSIAQGIDDCEIIDYSFDGENAIDEVLTQNVLVDIILDMETVSANSGKALSSYSANQIKNINILFDHHKKDILKLYRNQNYDNYVTGGGTNKSTSSYKKQFNRYAKLGLAWECIYKDIEVERKIA